jgi:hypothetical protein
VAARARRGALSGAGCGTCGQALQAIGVLGVDGAMRGAALQYLADLGDGLERLAFDLRAP